MKDCRSHILLVMLALASLAGCQTIQFERPQNLTATDWPTDDGDAMRSRMHEDSLALPLELAWQYSANAGFGPGSPLILQDRVLIANRKGEIHTVELETGRSRGFKQMGDVIEGSPLIHEGTLYIPAAWGRKVLIAFDLSRGVNRWRKEGVPFATSLMAHNDLILGIDVEGTLRAFDAADGEEAWSLSIGDHLSVEASPVRLSSTDILIADVEGRIHRVNLEDRAVVWTRDVGAPIYTTPAVSDAGIALSTTRGSVHWVDAETGQDRWSAHINERIRMGAPAIGADGVILGATDGQVRSLSLENGNEQWAVQFDDVITAAPLVAGNTVFIGTLGKQLFALRASDGHIRWETEVKGRIKSAMALADGGLLVLTEPKWLMYYTPGQRDDDDTRLAEAGQ